MSAGGKAARLRRSISGPKLAVTVEDEDGSQPLAQQQLIRALSPSSSEGRHGVCAFEDPPNRNCRGWKVLLMDILQCKCPSCFYRIAHAGQY